MYFFHAQRIFAYFFYVLSCERDLHFSQALGLLKHPLRPFLPGTCRLIDLPRKSGHCIHLQIVEQAESHRLLKLLVGHPE